MNMISGKIIAVSAMVNAQFKREGQVSKSAFWITGLNKANPRIVDQNHRMFKFH